MAGGMRASPASMPPTGIARKRIAQAMTSTMPAPISGRPCQPIAPASAASKASAGVSRPMASTVPGTA
ncbi:hypothetical protein D9M70_623810 [compost metagenome]